MATVVEHSKIYPSSWSTADDFSVPLIFFDMVWYGFPGNQIVFFFDLPCSKPHFLSTIVPDLKRSLSLTLAHFLPLAGNIIHPTNPAEKPVVRYESGQDSVTLVVCESNADLNWLTRNHPRDCDAFYAFAPQLPPATRSQDSISCPVLAVQVTLFPGQGLCIGYVTHHAVADASTVSSFLHSMALINRSGDDDDGDHIAIRARLARANCLPFYDRKTVTNINGLDATYWDLIVKSRAPMEPPRLKLPIHKQRSTFVLKREEIQKLKKNLVSAGCNNASSFTVACALLWVCSAKSAARGGEVVGDDEVEYLCFLADCRERLKPPLPATYFGNCVALCMLQAELKHGQAKGADGFAMAAKAIGQAIQKSVSNENGILHGAEHWWEESRKLAEKRVHGVSGSPRFDFYGADYGWGKPKNLEALFTDGGDRSFFLCKSRDFEGGLEISLSKPMLQMHAYAAVFKQLLIHFLK